MNALQSEHPRTNIGKSSLNLGTSLMGASSGCLASAVATRALSSMLHPEHLLTHPLVSYGLPAIGLILGTTLVISVISRTHFTKDQLEPTKKVAKALLYPTIVALLSVISFSIFVGFYVAIHFNIPSILIFILPFLIVPAAINAAWPVVYGVGIGTGMLLAQHLVSTQALDARGVA